MCKTTKHKTTRQYFCSIKPILLIRIVDIKINCSLFSLNYINKCAFLEPTFSEVTCSTECWKVVIN